MATASRRQESNGIVLTPFTPPDVPSMNFVEILIATGADKRTIKVAAAGRVVPTDPAIVLAERTDNKP